MISLISANCKDALDPTEELRFANLAANADEVNRHIQAPHMYGAWQEIEFSDFHSGVLTDAAKYAPLVDLGCNGMSFALCSRYARRFGFSEYT